MARLPFLLVAGALGATAAPAAAAGDLLLRQDLAQRSASASPQSLLAFAQLTDTHVIDEESPLRVEFTDRLNSVFTSAYRPQEGLSAQVADQMVRAVRAASGPATGAPLALAMTTGDNTDNTQCNETRWFIDGLDGGRIDPDSGTGASAHPCAAPALPASCAPAGSSARRYEGVRGGGEYYEPDGPGDGVGYAPADGVPDVPGLFDDQNVPFDTPGLGMPWYGIFGNHDALIQGNQPRNPAFEAIATGCAKVVSIGGDEAAGPLGAIADPASRVEQISPDPARKPLRKSEFIAEHFRTTGTPVGHGFSQANVESGMGNYAFEPVAGVRFVVLDSISEHGLEAGNIDDEQFRWLHEQLLAADGARQLSVVFAHHSLRTMGQPPVSPFPPGDAGGNLSPLVHFGLGLRESGRDEACPTTDPAAPTRLEETVKCLLLRHPSVIALVNGHEHGHRIDAFRGAAGQNGFYEINTASHIDFPQQSRVLELLDNADGTLSVATRVVDHAAAADPAAATTEVERLASVSRLLSRHERHGGTSGTGDADDRDVELVLPHPFSR